MKKLAILLLAGIISYANAMQQNALPMAASSSSTACLQAQGITFNPIPRPLVPELQIFKNNNYAGRISYGKKETEEDGNIWEIVRIKIERNYRHKGLGKALFIECFKKMIALKVDKITWESCPLEVDVADKKYNLARQELDSWYTKIINDYIVPMKPGSLEKKETESKTTQMTYTFA